MVLVEGYMDVIGATQAGVTEVVASCGTALTTEQIRAMKRHSQNVHLNFDPDAAGTKASERSITLLLDENMHVRMVELEERAGPRRILQETWRGIVPRTRRRRERLLLLAGGPGAGALQHARAAGAHRSVPVSCCLPFRG